MAKNKNASGSNQKTMSVLAHILTFLGGFIVPLIILLASDDEYVKKHARRSLNWQISSAIYISISVIILLISIPFMLIFIGIIPFAIAILAIIAISVLDIIFVIMASVKASNLELWDYPLSIHFLRD